MTYRYTVLDDCEGLEGGPRYEIIDIDGFVSCIVDDEDIARLFCASTDLLEALTDLIERDRAGAVECGFMDDEMTWLEDGRRAIAKATGSSA